MIETANSSSNEEDGNGSTLQSVWDGEVGKSMHTVTLYFLCSEYTETNHTVLNKLFQNLPA